MKVTLGGKELTLTFGMMAAEEVANRQAKGSSGWLKLITDIVYGGYLNEVYLAEAEKELSYRDVAGLVEEEIDGDKIAMIFDTYMSSKGGLKMLPLVSGSDEDGKATKKKGTSKPTGTKLKGSPSGG